MGTSRNISNELKAFFNRQKIFKILLPMDIVILILALGILVINEFVCVGGLMYSIAYYMFLLGLLLTYANYNQKMLYIGFFSYGAIQFINLLKGIFTKYSYFNYHAFFTTLIFGWIGYLIFKHYAISQNQKVN